MNIMPNKPTIIKLRKNGDYLEVVTVFSGSETVWGVLHGDFLEEINVRKADIMAWEGLPEDKKFVTEMHFSLNFEDYVINQKSLPPDAGQGESE